MPEAIARPSTHRSQRSSHGHANATGFRNKGVRQSPLKSPQRHTPSHEISLRYPANKASRTTPIPAPGSRKNTEGGLRGPSRPIKGRWRGRPSVRISRAAARTRWRAEETLASTCDITIAAELPLPDRNTKCIVPQRETRLLITCDKRLAATSNAGPTLRFRPMAANEEITAMDGYTYQALTISRVELPGPHRARRGVVPATALPARRVDHLPPKVHARRHRLVAASSSRRPATRSNPVQSQRDPAPATPADPTKGTS